VSEIVDAFAAVADTAKGSLIDEWPVAVAGGCSLGAPVNVALHCISASSRLAACETLRVGFNLNEHFAPTAHACLQVKLLTVCVSSQVANFPLLLASLCVWPLKTSGKHAEPGCLKCTLIFCAATNVGCRFCWKRRLMKF
jgi:hypothetical protein